MMSILKTVSPLSRPSKRSFLSGAWILCCWLVLLLPTAWAVAALYFDFPISWLRAPLAGTYVLAMLLAFVFVRGSLRAMAVFLGGFLIVVGWWFTLKPSNTRSWQPDVAQTAWAEIRGDEVTFHNVRQCDYVTETNFTTRWTTRNVRLSKLTGIDIALTYWGSPWMAHPIVSFQFSDAPPLCFSIETRKEAGESYSAVRGLFRQFELIYLVADERDVVRLRTNFRVGEDVYLYHLRLTPEQTRGRFMDYLQRVNELHTAPAWYNAVTANCTTSIRSQSSATERARWDWRMLLNGKSDEMMHERGALTGDLPFAELKERVHINARAKAAGAAPNFSELIRLGNPGMTP